MNDEDCSEKYDSTMSAYCKKYFDAHSSEPL